MKTKARHFARHSRTWRFALYSGINLDVTKTIRSTLKTALFNMASASNASHLISYWYRFVAMQCSILSFHFKINLSGLSLPTNIKIYSMEELYYKIWNIRKKAFLNSRSYNYIAFIYLFTLAQWVEYASKICPTLSESSCIYINILNNYINILNTILKYCVCIYIRIL